MFQERTNDLLSMLNGNAVATLTFNQLHGGHGPVQNQEYAMNMGRGTMTAQSNRGFS